MTNQLVEAEQTPGVGQNGLRSIARLQVQVLPDGSVDRNTAAQILNRKPKTLAMWAIRKTGPRFVRDGAGRCFYFLTDLAAFKAGKAS
jgi:hypothetical protein